jgi:type II secretory pathway component GspD/PulD (secretin)
VLDGQTIVIGGLIEDSVTDNVQKIPLLGDIPIAGALFRHTQKEKSKKELLIFLTPRVAKEPTLLTPISDSERERSTIQDDKATADLFRKHMDGMEIKPGSTAEPNAPTTETKKPAVEPKQ